MRGVQAGKFKLQRAGHGVPSFEGINGDPKRTVSELTDMAGNVASAKPLPPSKQA
jgi:hypothetical protein